MKTRFAAAVLSVVCVAGSAFGQASFRTIDPDKGFDYTVIQDVSADGTKVLVSLQNSTQRKTIPFSYVLNLADDARQDMTDPGGRSLNALAISADGSTVAGYLSGGAFDSGAFVWTEEYYFEIGGLIGGNLTYATGISADGSVVVGSTGSNIGDPYQQGWRWTAETGFVPLNDIGDDILTFSAVNKVSDDGSTVVGYGTIGDFDGDTDDFQRGAVWPDGGVDPIDIGILPNPYNYGIEGRAASVDGSVVIGFGPTVLADNTFVTRGFRWTAKDGVVDLGGFPGMPNASITLLDCSGDGNTAVGYMMSGWVDTWEAVVWTQADGYRTLRSMLADEGVIIPTNIRLRETYCSNDGKVIGGWAYNSTTNKYVGYVATLPSGGTTCDADFNTDGVVNSQDFFDFMNAFFASSPNADYNDDKVINSQDFFDFMNDFFVPCEG